MIFLNMSNSIGILIGTATETTTGSIILTLGIVLLVVMAIALMFGIPLEFTMILCLPLMFSYMAFYGNYVAIGSVMLIYLALVFTKRFIFK